MDAFRGPDGLGIYLTGAAADGAAQPDPAVSLGGYRSATEIAQVGHLEHGVSGELRVAWASGAVGPGLASVAPGEGGLVLTTASGSGSAVSLVAGASAVLTSADPDEAVRIERSESSATPASRGASECQGMPVYGGLGMAPVTEAQRASGVTTYRAVMLYAHGAYGCPSVRVWVGSQPSQGTVSLATETPSSGAIQTIADETAAPTGLSWSAPATEAAALAVGTIHSGGMAGLWLRRALPAGASGSVSEEPEIRVSYVAA